MTNRSLGTTILVLGLILGGIGLVTALSLAWTRGPNSAPNEMLGSASLIIVILSGWIQSLLRAKADAEQP